MPGPLISCAASSYAPGSVHPHSHLEGRKNWPFVASFLRRGLCQLQECLNEEEIASCYKSVAVVFFVPSSEGVGVPNNGLCDVLICLKSRAAIAWAPSTFSISARSEMTSTFNSMIHTVQSLGLQQEFLDRGFAEFKLRDHGRSAPPSLCLSS